MVVGDLLKDSCKLIRSRFEFLIRKLATGGPLIGEHIVRRFKKNDDDEDSDSELYSGEIISYKKPYWRVYYDADGDEQELQISEVLECLVYQN